MSDPPRLYGLKALVTSAAEGIGEAVSRTLVKHGATVLAVDSPHSGVEQQFAGVKGIVPMPANLGDLELLPDVITLGAERLDGLDILVNEYPLVFDAPLDGADESFDKLLANRAERIIIACRAALPRLQKSPAGRIINIGLPRSLFAVNADDAFVQAERNLSDVTRALAAETGEFGITANYVQPGAIMTAASRKVFKKDKSLRDFCIRRSAAARLGEPIDVARVVLFLASDDAMFVSGSGVLVDGGPSGD